MLKKQEIKLLILCDLEDFNYKDVLEELNELKRRHFDMVFVLGNVDKIMMMEISALFETALICALPKDTYSKSQFTELGILDFNLRKQRIDQTYVMGYGSRFYNPKGVPIDKIPECWADILVSYHAPIRINDNPDYRNEELGSEEINRYGAFRNPLIIFHGGRKCNKETIISNGTKYISCYGIVPYILTYYKEIDEKEGGDK